MSDEETKDELNLDFIEGTPSDDGDDKNDDDVTDDDDKSGKDHSDDDAGKKTEDDHSDDDPEKKGGVQKKIDKLTRKMRDYEREVIYLRGRLDAPSQQKPSKTDDATPAKIERDDFETDAEYFEALNQRNLEILKAEQKKEKDQEIELRDKELKEKEQTFINGQFDIGRQKYSDFDEVALDPNSHNLTREMFDAAKGENLADILYVLGKNPGVSNKIASLSATQQVKEIGKIEARIEKAREIKPKNKIPEDEPAPTVNSSGVKSQNIKDVKDMTFSERMAHWDAEREARLKREHGLA